jgi:UDP-N-acetylglucosamine 2-epimerase (non-hydrolysing)
VHPRIHLTPPLAYRLFVHLLHKCTLILTDSGGIQEEAPSLRKPALVLRDRTERTEALGPGQIRVVGRSPSRIEAEAIRLLTDEHAYAAMQRGANPFGDGMAASRIVEALDRWFAGMAPLLPREREFHPDAADQRDVA